MSIYQTNSAEECAYLLGHSESKAVFVEDAEQLAKVREVQAELPHLEHIVVFDAAEADDLADAVTLEELRRRRGSRFSHETSPMRPESSRRRSR